MHVLSIHRKIMTTPIVYIKTTCYLYGSACVIKLNRILAPLQAVMFLPQQVAHVLHLCLGCFILFKCLSQDYQKTTGQNLVQKSATRVQKAVVNAMLQCREKSPINVLTVTNWPVITKKLFLYCTQLTDIRDAKRHLEAEFRVTLKSVSRISVRMTEKPFYILCHE